MDDLSAFEVIAHEWLSFAPWLALLGVAAWRWRYELLELVARLAGTTWDLIDPDPPAEVERRPVPPRHVRVLPKDAVE
ncbi:MAG: hypothetical protein AB7H43_14470 [Acidimicrobiia bacterium]